MPTGGLYVAQAQARDLSFLPEEWTLEWFGMAWRGMASPSVRGRAAAHRRRVCATRGCDAAATMTPWSRLHDSLPKHRREREKE